MDIRGGMISPDVRAGPGMRWAGYLPDRGYFGFLPKAVLKARERAIPLERRRQWLNAKLADLCREPGALCIGTDAAKPLEERYQASCAAVVYRQGVRVHMTRHAAGKALASEAELYAIRSGVDRKSTRLNSSHSGESRMPSSA